MRLIAIIFILFITPLYSQSDFEVAVDELFINQNDSIPGCAILIMNEDSVLYKKCIGLANLEYGHPISSNTVFNASSLSKQFVAFGILLLSDQGDLNLNDDIQNYIPDFPIYDQPITINHLLTHTSGIRDQWGLLKLVGYRFDDFISNEHIFNLLKAQKKLNFDPGTQFEYSHSNYTLLAKIIESTTNQNLNDFMRAHIFDPLHMDDTFYLDSSNRVINNRAYSYEFVDGSYQKVNLNYQNYGPTNLMTTLDDLSKWASNFLNKTIGSDAIFDALNAHTFLSDGLIAIAADLGEEKIIGSRGQFYRKYKGLDFYSHGGALGGFRSFLGRFPDDGLSIILLSNESSFNTYSTALKIADAYFGLKTDPVVKIKEEKQEPGDESKRRTDEFKKYEGDYFSEELDVVARIRYNQGKLKFDLKREVDIDLTWENEDEFTLMMEGLVSINFYVNGEKGFEGMVMSCKGVKGIEFSKVEMTAPSRKE